MKIGILTSGGNAPCLSSSISFLLSEISDRKLKCDIIGYKNGYRGLLTDDFINLNNAHEISNLLQNTGGSILGNSRVKLANTEDCIRKKYISEGDDPITVAANNLRENNIDCLITIGGDDTNLTARDLSFYLKKNGYDMNVVGLPKTIDNDISPISLSLGALTAAEQTKLFFENIVSENNMNPNQLIIHEIMGRHSGWLTAYSSRLYFDAMKKNKLFSTAFFDKSKYKIHALYLPEEKIDLDSEIKRLREVMLANGNVNVFLAEGSISEMILKNNDIESEYDAFGHVKLDKLNPGMFLSSLISDKIGAEKTLIQKSGYFARSSYPNQDDLNLIKKSCEFAVDALFNKENGVVGMDSENSGKVSLINFDRIKGGKPFDIYEDWYIKMKNDIILNN